MKRSQLKQIIKEEIQNVLNEKCDKNIKNHLFINMKVMFQKKRQKPNLSWLRCHIKWMKQAEIHQTIILLILEICGMKQIHLSIPMCCQPLKTISIDSTYLFRTKEVRVKEDRVPQIEIMYRYNHNIIKQDIFQVPSVQDPGYNLREWAPGVNFIKH